MGKATNNVSFKFSEEKCIFYTVLKALIALKKRDIMPVSAKDIQDYIEYFTIPLFKIEEILDELYEYSFVMREELPNENRKYILMLV